VVVVVVVVDTKAKAGLADGASSQLRKVVKYLLL
jgi:hypothetical protein